MSSLWEKIFGDKDLSEFELKASCRRGYTFPFNKVSIEVPKGEGDTGYGNYTWKDVALLRIGDSYYYNNRQVMFRMFASNLPDVNDISSGDRADTLYDLYFDLFCVFKTTKKGNWVVPISSVHKAEEMVKSGTKMNIIKQYMSARWIPNEAYKKYCHPSPKRSAKSLNVRLRRQKAILEGQLAECNFRLNLPAMRQITEDELYGK